MHQYDGDEMVDGIYSITFRGAADWGLGMIVLHGGTVTGADAAGATYDGTYKAEGESVSFRLTMTVPPGVVLVQGTRARPVSYDIPIAASVPAKALENSEPVTLEMPPGPVNVIFRRLRKFG
jgi:hypothetical protein